MATRLPSAGCAWSAAKPGFGACRQESRCKRRRPRSTSPPSRRSADSTPTSSRPRSAGFSRSRGRRQRQPRRHRGPRPEGCVVRPGTRRCEPVTRSAPVAGLHRGGSRATTALVVHESKRSSTHRHFTSSPGQITDPKNGESGRVCVERSEKTGPRSRHRSPADSVVEVLPRGAWPAIADGRRLG